MKKASLPGILAGAVLAVLLLLFVRKVSQPQVLLYICHFVFILLMLGWAVVTAVQVWLRKKAVLSEAFHLLWVSLIIAMAAVLTVFFLEGRGADALPALSWLPYEGVTGQGMILTMSFIVLVWAGYIFLERTVPGRDPYLYPLVCFLAGMGLILLFRLSPDLWEIRKSGVMARLSWTQLRSIGISFLVLAGAVLFFSVRRVETLTRKRYGYALLSIVLISLTAVFGVEINGRRLSLNLGVMNFQTVELVKIFALLFMTGYFRYEMAFMETGKNVFNLPRKRYLLPYMTMWVLILLPIFLQKDLGPTALIFMLFVGVFYLGTGSWISVAFGLGIMAAAGFGAYFAGVPSMVKTRVDMWLSPFEYSQNMAEALWGIGSGGWFGTGLARGLCHRIPVVQSDFNFAAIAEECGFLGVAVILTAFAVLVSRTLAIALRADRPFVQLFAAGIGLLWTCQVFIIVGGNTGLLPLTGITLPFISYGGSSLLINFLAAGMMIRMSHDVNI